MTTKSKTEPTSQAMYDASRKRRVTKRRRRDGGEDIGYLNITPMLDMMTIILVFLIKSFSASAENVNVANLTLPHSTSSLKVEEALRLIITSDQIVVDHKEVAHLKDEQIAVSDLPGGKGSYLIKPLYDALSAKAKYFKEVEEGGGSQFLGRIAVIADEKTNYNTLFKVLYTAGRSEFGAFKLFVRSENASN